MSNESAHPVVKKYEGYGLVAGVGVGLLLGVMYSGPHFHDWPAGASLLAILGSGAAGAIVGYLAVAIAVGSTARGPSVDAGISDNGLGSGGHSGAGDSGGSGGGDGGSDG